ncbi:hypothetical protein TcWFU_000832 [Taenia crassiceps]|uniref:Uncharacterized protein n=1 Tax=Taenia crassiceps TaxID=6207 RepID=A0ABR4QFU1_9CEST
MPILPTFSSPSTQVAPIAGCLEDVVGGGDNMASCSGSGFGQHLGSSCLESGIARANKTHFRANSNALSPRGGGGGSSSSNVGGGVQSSHSHAQHGMMPTGGAVTMATPIPCHSSGSGAMSHVSPSFPPSCLPVGTTGSTSGGGRSSSSSSLSGTDGSVNAAVETFENVTSLNRSTETSPLPSPTAVPDVRTTEAHGLQSAHLQPRFPPQFSHIVGPFSCTTISSPSPYQHETLPSESRLQPPIINQSTMTFASPVVFETDVEPSAITN